MARKQILINGCQGVEKQLKPRYLYEYGGVLLLWQIGRLVILSAFKQGEFLPCAHGCDLIFDPGNFQTTESECVSHNWIELSLSKKASLSRLVAAWRCQKVIWPTISPDFPFPSKIKSCFSDVKIPNTIIMIGGWKAIDASNNWISADDIV